MYTKGEKVMKVTNENSCSINTKKFDKSLADKLETAGFSNKAIKQLLTITKISMEENDVEELQLQEEAEKEAAAFSEKSKNTINKLNLWAEHSFLDGEEPSGFDDDYNFAIPLRIPFYIIAPANLDRLMDEGGYEELGDLWDELSDVDTFVRVCVEVLNGFEFQLDLLEFNSMTKIEFKDKLKEEVAEFISCCNY